MSKGDTLNQKIQRKIKLLFIRSEHLCNVYIGKGKEYLKPVLFIEGKLHLHLFHHIPIKEIDLSQVLMQLNNLLKNHSCNQTIENYYKEVLELQKLITKKYPRKRLPIEEENERIS